MHANVRILCYLLFNEIFSILFLITQIHNNVVGIANKIMIYNLLILCFTSIYLAFIQCAMYNRRV